MDLYFIRHGQIDSNINKIYAGWSDESLNPLGKTQAKQAGFALRKENITKLYCSPIKRTYETAAIIGSITGQIPVIEESFKELCLGPWEGLSEDQIALKYPDQWEIWNKTPADLLMKGRESLDDLLKRALKGINKLRLTTGGNIAIVTHVAIIRVLCLYSINRGLNNYRDIQVPKNGGIYLLKNERHFKELNPKKN